MRQYVAENTKIPSASCDMLFAVTSGTFCLVWNVRMPKKVLATLHTENIVLSTHCKVQLCKLKGLTGQILFVHHHHPIHQMINHPHLCLQKRGRPTIECLRGPNSLRFDHATFQQWVLFAKNLLLAFKPRLPSHHYKKKQPRIRWKRIRLMMETRRISSVLHCHVHQE